MDDLPIDLDGRGPAGATFGTASPDWRQNLSLGAQFDGDAVCIAMQAAALRGPGFEKRYPVYCRWSGYRRNDAGPEACLADFEQVFLPLGLQRLSWDLDSSEGCRPMSGWWTRHDAAVYLSCGEKDNTFLTYTTGEADQLRDQLRTWADASFNREPPIGTVYMMVMAKSGPKFHNVGKAGRGLERGNYSPAVLQAYDRIRGELGAQQPRGRLTILSGPPGTGKTYLIRGLLQEVTDVIFVVVPQHVLASLVEPSGLTALTELKGQHSHEDEHRPVVLVLEDADDALAPREGGDTNTISALLNMGDGITGSVLDVRILATTNRRHHEFDDAIMRPGRLSTATEVEKLDTAQAELVYQRLTGKPALRFPRPDSGEDPLKTYPLFTQPVTVAEVYQKAYDDGWKAQPVKTKRMGFGS